MGNRSHKNTSPEILSALRENRRDDVPRDVGQAVVAALVFEGEPRVVDAQAMKQRRVQIVHVHRVAGRRCRRSRPFRPASCPA